MKSLNTLLASAIFAIVSAALPLNAIAGETRTIPNPLGQNWPWELVSMDFSPGAIQPDWVATIEGVPEPRPIQVEKVTAGEKPMDRVWFIATLGRKTAVAKVDFGPGNAVSPLKVSRDGDATIVANGVSELRLRLGAITAGTPLSKVPHWLGGVRVKGDSRWDGETRFDGKSLVNKVSVQQVASGPVFDEWRVEYVFTDPGRSGEVAAVPIALGKQSFRFPPNQIPTETIAKDDRRYEVGIRVVMGHPWIEIDERYHLPPDPSVDGFGNHQYTIDVGKTGGIPVDTMLWCRWFEYDSFGGNSSQLVDPASPRAVQKGRPFAQLRARWAQSPAGAQDCIATSGGRTGIPIDIMRSQVTDRLSAVLKARSGEGKNAAALKPFIDQIEPARELLDKAKDGDIASRKTIAKAGALLGIDLPAGENYLADAPAIGVIAAYPSKWVGPYDATISVQALDGNHASYRFPLTDGGTNQETGQSQHYGNRCWALVVGERQRFDSTGKIEELIRTTTDWTLTALINRYVLNWDGMGSGKVGPNPSQYLDRRYQCDDVNPTNYGNRRMVNDGFEKNLKNGDQFGAMAAATAYIYTDLDSWPGWHNGWGPGNPNFHTDKYMATLFAAVTMQKHPHARDWLAFGRSCLDADLAKVITAPDGVGSECPGYSGYSFGLQATVAKSLLDAGLGNPFAENPLVAKTLTWHRKLLTPFDRRLGLRHEAPIGDTHRWTSGAQFEKFIPFYEKADPKVADELRIAQELCKSKSVAGAGQLDWSSQAFSGFGAILRNRFGTDEESFLTLKSGSTHGHYHNDDQSFHWYHRGTPIALDYNCSYHPRGDHAALHNTITLENAGTVVHNARNTAVEAMEQPDGPADLVRFSSSVGGDVVVADRRIDRVIMSPIDPEDSEFNRGYPSRKVDAQHRRLLLMRKQENPNALSDYLVVRDEIHTTEPQQVNLHLLARDAKIDGSRVLLTGQYDQDILVQVVEATDLKIDHRYWAYADEWMAPPAEFLPKPGESTADWDKRLPAERPGKDWKPTYIKKNESGSSQKAWHDLIEATHGTAMMPPPGWTSTWTYGECQQWLRFHTKPGTPVTMVIYPYPRGQTPPTITREGDMISIVSGANKDIVMLSTASGAKVNDTTLLGPELVKPN